MGCASNGPLLRSPVPALLALAQAFRWEPSRWCPGDPDGPEIRSHSHGRPSGEQVEAVCPVVAGRARDLGSGDPVLALPRPLC